jgi:fatty-acyl-CoA synthase
VSGHVGTVRHGISEWLSFWGRYTPGRPALLFRDQTITWAQFEDRAARLAGGLLAAGIRGGDRIGYLSRNNPEFFDVMMACARIGAVFVPFNIRLSAGEIRYMAQDAGLSLLICETFFADRLQDTMEQVGAVYFLDPPGGERSYEDLLLGVPVRTADGVTLDQTVALSYTSGTTGRSKAAMITHGNCSATSIAVISADGIGPADRVIQPAPLAFAGSMLAISMAMLHAGASMVIERDATPERLLDLVDHGGVTMLKLVPVFYQMMAASPAFAGSDLSGLRTATFGGAPASLELLRLYQARGVGLSSAYGLTEGCGYNLGLPSEEAFERVGWAGLPLPFQRCRVVDDNGVPVAPGEIGELTISGPCVMRGYWGAPEATAAAIRDGWLHTGDLAVTDEKGYYKIVDRKKDMIISGGLNVYPAEVERVLNAHPAVAEVAVVGVPDERWGEAPLACVVSHDPALTLQDLIRSCAGELADYKRPRHLRLLTELPRNSNGKVLKGRLREQEWDAGQMGGKP